MKTDYLTHEELQHIEHANKILTDHQELVKLVINETESMLNTYIPILKDYIRTIVDVRSSFGDEVKHIINSTRELSIVTKNTQQMVDFGSQLKKIDDLLTPELIEKLRKVIK